MDEVIRRKERIGRRSISSVPGASPLAGGMNNNGSSGSGSTGGPGLGRRMSTSAGRTIKPTQAANAAAAGANTNSNNATSVGGVGGTNLVSTEQYCVSENNEELQVFQDLMAAVNAAQTIFVEEQETGGGTGGAVASQQDKASSKKKNSTVSAGMFLFCFCFILHN